MKNENNHHKNGHALYLAETGHGKSHCMMRCSGIPNSGVRVVLFDPKKDHKCNRYDSRAAFARALAKANASGKGFRIGYSGLAGPEIFEWWCQCVWSILDGKKETYAIFEEYGGQCPGPGLLNPRKVPYHYKLWTMGRAYGLKIHAASQRPQNISTDAIENAGTIYAGAMGSRAARSIEMETDIDPKDLKLLKVGEFLCWKRGQGIKKINVF